MNETQVNAMLQSLTNQLGNATMGIAQRDGEIAVLKARIAELEEKPHEQKREA